MDSRLAAFGKIAAHLTHPLVLVGFVGMLYFGVHGQLIQSGIIQPLDPEANSAVVLAILEYGFWIMLAVAVLGFGLSYLKSSRQ